MTILSNRLVATAVAIGSVCRTSKSRVHFVVISTDKEEFRPYFDKLEDCKATGSDLELITIDEATDSLLELGFQPIWWQVEHNMTVDDGSDTKEWGVQTPYTHDKHAHALNLLRFYLPYLPSLAGINKFLFLDDDVVLRRDVQEIFELETQPNVALLAGCQHWVWNGNAVGDFETSWNMSVRKTNYIGNHAVVCNKDEEQPYGCLTASLEDELSLVSQLLDHDSPLSARPLERQAFNMGLNIFEVEQWKTLKLSHRFEQWVDASNRLRLFPLDTLAFGLGLAYLALGDAVQCYEPGPISHLVGMAFVEKEAYEAAGWPLPRIQNEAYALHYNGAHKPWEDIAENRTCSTDVPSGILDFWKKTCESVGICSCEHR